MKWTKKNIFWTTALCILGVACFPANPLVLMGVIEVKSYGALFILGWVVWAFGMALVLAPIIMFPRHGGVHKGKPFVNTTRLVDTGIYAVVRHPQYLGGILSIFVTSLLWYPHWLFGVLGAMGTATVYISAKEEERYLTRQFGDDYRRYMKRVPRMNLVAGVIRSIRRKAA